MEPKLTEYPYPKFFLIMCNYQPKAMALVDCPWGPGSFTYLDINNKFVFIKLEYGN